MKKNPFSRGVFRRRHAGEGIFFAAEKNFGQRYNQRSGKRSLMTLIVANVASSGP